MFVFFLCLFFRFDIFSFSADLLALHRNSWCCFNQSFLILIFAVTMWLKKECHKKRKRVKSMWEWRIGNWYWDWGDKKAKWKQRKIESDVAAGS